jgi:ribosomal protein S18 acetylase RimI-like enzyme
MITLNLEEQQLKDILKQALLEIFEERRDLAESLFLEALEDWALLQAIREGEATDNATREEVFDVLENI